MNCLLVEPTEACFLWPGTPVEPPSLCTILVVFDTLFVSWARNWFLEEEVAYPDLFRSPCYVMLLDTMGPFPP
jgi:hypothetical protein